jgi:molecular chaperone DnaJ
MNFYVILGVPENASTSEIKRAYRRLARRYHPGINPGDRSAEVKFQQVSEAYETLVDPNRRRQYDSAGQAPFGDAGRRESQPFAFAEFDFTVARHGTEASTFTELFADVLHPVPQPDEWRPEPGADLHASLTLSFAAAARGVERQILVTRQVACRACSGSGRLQAYDGQCAQCGGAGQVRWARGHMVLAKPCASCGGAGRRTWQRCVVCSGEGRTVRSETLTVAVPAGVADGSRLRLREYGHAGRHGGPAGDLSVTVHVQPHPLFTRRGDDLVAVLPVAVHEAALGARVDVPTLDGSVKLRIPPGTQAGERLRVTGAGVPTPSGGRGDVIFEVRLVLPATLDERSRELMREFGERNPADVRAALPQADV